MTDPNNRENLVCVVYQGQPEKNCGRDNNNPPPETRDYHIQTAKTLPTPYYRIKNFQVLL